MTSSDRGMPGRRRRIAVASLAGLAVLAGATLLGVEAWYQGRFETPLRLHGEALAANVDAYCAEEAALGRDPWFHEGRTEGDAGLLLKALEARRCATEANRCIALTRGVTVEDPASGMSSLASSVAWIPWAPGRLARSHLARGVLASTLGDLTALYENTTKHPAPLHGQAGISTP
ncbi:hypothetical protein ACIHQR_27485 [Corallococcus coralloides]|uniref:hypothetical protein n=1 Tax=Corallococcus coralloides TaxID=184914 RepID=UPI0038503259